MPASRCPAAGGPSTLAAIGLALSACETVPATPPSPAPTPGYAPVRSPRDAGAIDAAPDAPSELAEVPDPRPWVFRQLRLGGAVHPRRQTWILRRAGDRASLRLTVESAPSESGWAMPAAWSPIRSETFVGTWHRDNERTVFELASATGAPVTLTCRSQRLAVHGAGANLVPAPDFHGECGNQGVWRPTARQPMDVLSCAASHRDPVVDLGQLGYFAVPLSPVPGVEMLSVNDDCTLQGSGYRRGSFTG